MAFLDALVPSTLFFKNREYGVGSIKFDLILSESHNMANQVTEHNVEDGSVISDHIKNELENGALSGLITNFSLNVFGAFTNRAQDAFDALVQLWKEKTLVTIVTVMKVYEDVAITNVNVDRAEDTGEAIVLNISFKKVNVVKLETVVIGAVANKLADMKSSQNRQAAPAADAGRTTGQ